MVKIIVPTKAAKRSDVEYAVSMLEKHVKGYEIGLEIIGDKEHFERQEYLERIKNNINSLAKGMFLSVHGFSGLNVYKYANLTESSGKMFLDIYIQLAKDVGAKYVHVHGGVGRRGEIFSGDEKLNKLNGIRKSLLEQYNSMDFPISLGIENIPNPTGGDDESKDTNPNTVWRDALETLEDCLTIVKDSDLKVTLDTCHYAADKTDTNLLPAIDKLGKHLCYFHLSDVAGFWIPYKSMFTEGVPIGEGRIGIDNFRIAIKYLLKNKPESIFCVEVANKNYHVLEESKRSINTLLNLI